MTDARDHPHLPRCSEHVDSPRCMCRGVSPHGIHWSYLMPQHAGSQSVVSHLHHALGVRSCVHGHVSDVRVLLDANVSFVFTFVANPYRRVVTAIAWDMAPKNATKLLGRRRVALFRRRVHDCLYPVRVPFCLALRAQAEVIRESEEAGILRFVGRTAALDRDLARLLRVLGYNTTNGSLNGSKARVRLPYHCVSSCARDAGGQPPLEWYDEPTASLVRTHFGSDFTRFGFSPEPTRMWEVPPHRFMVGRRRQGSAGRVLADHMPGLTRIESTPSYKPLEMYVAIMTSRLYHQTRCAYAKATWLAVLPRSHYLFYSDADEPSLPAIAILPQPNGSRNIERRRAIFTEGAAAERITRLALAQRKWLPAMAHARAAAAKLNAQWTLVVDDDTLVVPVNVRRVLADYADPSGRSWLIGQACTCASCGTASPAFERARTSRVMCGGVSMQRL